MKKPHTLKVETLFQQWWNLGHHWYELLAFLLNQQQYIPPVWQQRIRGWPLLKQIKHQLHIKCQLEILIKNYILLFISNKTIIADTKLPTAISKDIQSKMKAFSKLFHVFCCSFQLKKTWNLTYIQLIHSNKRSNNERTYFIEVIRNIIDMLKRWFPWC